MNLVYYYKINGNINRKVLDTSILSSKEKNRARAFRFAKDFNLYVAGKLLAKKIIAPLFNLKPEEIKFITDKYDRPHLAFPKLKNFDFNISHSGDYVVLVISDKRAGIDIERIKPVDLKIAETCFHNKEIKYLHEQPKEKLENFYKIWTLKESFIKAIGQGLSYPLKNFYFNLYGDRPEINIINSNDGHVWNFVMHDIDPNYKLSVCLKCSELPSVIFFEDLY